MRTSTRRLSGLGVAGLAAAALPHADGRAARSIEVMLNSGARRRHHSLAADPTVPLAAPYVAFHTVTIVARTGELA